MEEFNFYDTHKDSTPAGLADFETLKAWAKTPPSLAKNKAKAITCHAANGKTKDVVLAHNSMSLCWCDIDKGDRALDSIKTSLAVLGCVALIYSTASSR